MWKMVADAVRKIAGAPSGLGLGQIRTMSFESRLGWQDLVVSPTSVTNIASYSTPSRTSSNGRASTTSGDSRHQRAVGVGRRSAGCGNRATLCRPTRRSERRSRRDNLTYNRPRHRGPAGHRQDMNSGCILTDYIEHAMAEAVYDKLDDGSFAGRVPPCRGVVALGSTLTECQRLLRSTFEDWLFLGLKLGHAVPVLSGIDLNAEPVREPLDAV